MDIVTTSLEALIQRATSNQNQCPDTAAIDAFCGLVNREPECAHTAARFITAKVHSMQEWEALQALHVLDACMKKCGSCFHAEVGKFRFLNELIKLVSPKYLGSHTPEPVRKRVLELMQSWTIQYPRETKIKEAYDMLKKQGVVKEERVPSLEAQRAAELSSGVTTSRHNQSIFQDEEKSRLLQKLLQSKNPDDLQAANRLIKTMVKEDERRIEMKSRHMTELEAVNNNVRLLNEMLDSYRPGQSSSQDLELINELHTSCQRFRPTVYKLANEVQGDETLFREVLSANDELAEVFDKYTAVIVQSVVASSHLKSNSDKSSTDGQTLLDLSTPSEENLPPVSSVLSKQMSDLEIDLSNTPSTQSKTSSKEPVSDITELGDIFSSISHVSNPVLQPSSVLASPLRLLPKSAVGKEEKQNVSRGLEDLDVLGETLLKESLSTSQNKVASQFNRPAVKVPMNQLNRAQPSQTASPQHSPVLPAGSDNLDLITSNTEPPVQNALIVSESDLMNVSSEVTVAQKPGAVQSDQAKAISQSLLLENSLAAQQSNNVSEKSIVNVAELISTEPSLKVDNESKIVVQSKSPQPVNSDVVIKPLGDLSVPLGSIKPGSVSPLTVLDERGVLVVIHFGKETPRPDVSVYVIMTTSKNQSPLTDYLFQPVVPKKCKLKLQPPSSTELPAYNPFLPPAPITQVMLIASPDKEPIKLKFVISYTMDEETVTELGEVESLPLAST